MCLINFFNVKKYKLMNKGTEEMCDMSRYENLTMDIFKFRGPKMRAVRLKGHRIFVF